MTLGDSDLFLGIDAGSSSTKWSLVNSQGVLIDSGIADPIDGHIYRSESLNRFNRFLGQLEPRISKNIISVYAGITGASEIESENQSIKKIFHKYFPRTRVRVEIDVALGYRSAFDDETGIYLYAGTGSIAVIRNELDTLDVVGGWGYLLGDEGAGYWIGRELLRHILLDLEIGKSNVKLFDLVTDRLGIVNRSNVLKFTYENTRDEIAKLAKPLLQIASLGDSTAIQIVNEAARHLADLVIRAKERSPVGTSRIVFGGGVAQADGVLLQELERLLNAKVEVAGQNLSLDAALLALKN